jgi:hypothetical protein
MTNRLYRYVGPETRHRRAVGLPAGVVVDTPEALTTWVEQTGQTPDAEGRIAATFVVDADGRLRLADRRSEHVACAAGGDVRAAGEMFFTRNRGGWRVAEVSNHSTGYCPEPECWPAVAAALDLVPLPHPGRFTTEVVFRRCPTCGERNVVRDDWFVCAVCGTDLPTVWNF